MKRTLSISAFCFLFSALCFGQFNFSDLAFQPKPVASVSPEFSISNAYPGELRYWWDASLYNTNGGIVYLPDRWTNSLHFTNATASKFPKYTASKVNGKPAITYDTAQSLYTSSAFNHTNTAGYIFVMRYEYVWTNTPPEQRLLADFAGGPYFRATATSNARYIFGQTSAHYWTNVAGWHVLTFIRASGGSIAFYTNMTRVERISTSTDMGLNLSMCLGNRHTSEGQPFYASFAEIVTLNGIGQDTLHGYLTNNVVSNIVWSLTNKYAIAP